MKKGIVEVLQTEMLDFTAPVIINNLPSIDGLLVSQRQVIWGMKKAGMTSDKQFYKMLKAGGAIFNYYTLGDAPLYGVMKNLGNNYSLNKYLVPKGSYGNKNSRDGKGSAPRYIECKLDTYAENMLEGINKNAVPMKWNYDATEKEPVFLPSKIPNILTNLRISIAVAEANRMPSHNMEDVCSSITSYIKTKDINKSIELIKVPDLPSGGQIIYDKNIFDKIYTTGNGSFTILGKYKYDKDTNTITIYEIPYTTYIENIEDELENNIDKFSKELTDYHNGSDKDGLKLELYLKKNADIETVIQKLRKFTSYESKFACNFTILDLDGKTPVLVSLQDIFNKWIYHRQVCIKNELQFDYDKLNDRLHKLTGLKSILVDLDRVLEVIRNSKNDDDATNNVMHEFNLDKEQAEYVVSIKLLNINKGYINNRIKDVDNISKEIENISSTLSLEENINNIIIEQLDEVKKKYNQTRKTDILYEDKVIKIDNRDLIEDFTTTNILTNSMYYKKTRRFADADNQKLKENDEVISTIQCSNKGKVIFISNKGDAYMLNLSDISESKPSQLGIYLPTMLGLSNDESIIGMLCTNNYKGYVVIVYDSGKIAKVNLSSYETKTNRTKLSNCLTSSENGLPLLIVQITDDVEIELTDSFNKVKVINTSNVNAKSSRSTQGVTVFKSKKENWKVTSAKVLSIKQ
jgi:DNA gyrase/topoisomerase IV subunit A